ncbi:MAG: hypothetical protein IJX19_08440, partial [Clostridia bacterium]|nr:hypothetical protein [Clostridia bacterium]
MAFSQENDGRSFSKQYFKKPAKKEKARKNQAFSKELSSLLSNLQKGFGKELIHGLGDRLA